MKKLIPIILLSLLCSGCLLSYWENLAIGVLGGAVIEQVAKDSPEDDPEN